MAQFNLENYQEVKDRITTFIKDYPQGRIITNLEQFTQDFTKVMFKASLYNGENLIATGWAYEEKATSNVNKDSWVENCETSAIGRALANIGMNGSAPRPSREEMQKVQKMNPPQGPSPLDLQMVEYKAEAEKKGWSDVLQSIAFAKGFWKTYGDEEKKTIIDGIEKTVQEYRAKLPTF